MTIRHDIRSQITATHHNLANITPDTLDTILDRLHDHRRGYSTGHDPQGHTPAPGHDHDCDCDTCTPPPGYADRTGEHALTGDPADFDIDRLRNAVRELWRHSSTVAHLATQLAQRAPVVQWCASCRRDSGRQVPAYQQRYQDRCRWCGDARARNDGEDAPVAILRQYHRGGPKSISDQLIAAHPLPNGKLWKRPKR